MQSDTADRMKGNDIIDVRMANITIAVKANEVLHHVLHHMTYSCVMKFHKLLRKYLGIETLKTILIFHKLLRKYLGIEIYIFG